MTTFGRVHQFARWGILLFGSLAFLISLSTGKVDSCAQEMTDTGEVVELCSTPSITSGPVVALVLTGLVLLAPDLSEASIPGLLALKRRVESAEKKEEVQAQRQESLERLVTATMLRVDNVSSNRQDVHVGDRFIGAEAVRDAQGDLNAKEAEFTTRLKQDRPPEPNGNVTVTDRSGSWSLTPPSAESGEQALLGANLIRTWEFLNKCVLRPPVQAPDTSNAQEYASNQQRFLSVFADEIRLIRSARNSYVHGAPLSQEELRSVLEIAERLSKLAVQGGLDGRYAS